VAEPLDVALPKIGAYDHWIKVRDGQGREGYVAAWYVEAGPTIESTDEPDIPEATPEPLPEPEPAPVPVPISEPEPPVPSGSEIEPETAALSVRVLQSVGTSGLRLRKTPSLGGALVAVEKAGTALTVLEPEAGARPKVGVKGKWLHVSDPKGLQGYVAAEYVELREEPIPPVPGGDVTETPNETPEPLVEAVTLYVSPAASVGLRLRSAPTTNASTLKILAPNTPLTLLEGTVDLVGAYNLWLKVRDPEGTEGFVAAWYLRK
jgi:hypothetical protein